MTLTWLQILALAGAWAAGPLTTLLVVFVAPAITRRGWWPLVSLAAIVTFCLALLPWCEGPGWWFVTLVAAYFLFTSEINGILWWRNFLDGFPTAPQDDQIDACSDTIDVIGRAFITGWVEQPVVRTDHGR